MAVLERRAETTARDKVSVVELGSQERGVWLGQQGEQAGVEGGAQGKAMESWSPGIQYEGGGDGWPVKEGSELASFVRVFTPHPTNNADGQGQVRNPPGESRDGNWFGLRR